ncbi:MAG: immune inhibitor A [Polyangiaceae bacterium]
MLRKVKHFLFYVSMASIAATSACTCGDGEIPDLGGGGSGGTGGTGGAGGADLGPCGMDCSAVPTPLCSEAVCNTGQVLGPLFTCVVVASPKGTECDDGVFCTVGEACDAGQCVGGTKNDCGLALSPCDAAICSEETQSCTAAPVNDGTSCTPTDLCQVHGVCELGQCIGEPKDCLLSPLNECNTVTCDPATGQCIGTPDAFKDNSPCVLTGDLCQVDKTCQAGQCVGGVLKDCSTLDVACETGVCDPATGICSSVNAPPGTSCNEGVTACKVGACNSNGECKADVAPDNTVCNDHDACTTADACSGGACGGGSAVPGCSLYFKEGFEVCPNGWTFGGDWECGSPTNVGPPAAHTGDRVIATKTGSIYSVNQSFNTTVADSPSIDLTSATNPILSFWAWDHTEGGTFDGWNLKVSIDGGQTFTQVSTVTPAYPLTITGQPAWGGDHSAEGWKNYQADLTAYAGHSVILRFAFRSDGATVYPGVYVDDLFVGEPLQNPLYVITSSLPDVYVGMGFSASMARVGGSGAAQWSIAPGGVNTGWLTINPTTGALTGTPTATDVGPVTVTVHVEEPGLPSNYDEKTYTFDVNPAAYYTSFEGACPAGWTLAGTWQCGVPTLVGPPSAAAGTQCIATRISANYLNSQSFSSSNATSPDIDLANSPFPTLTFRMWIDTEGGTFDGANLKISTDGGATYQVVDTVSPAYTLMIGGEPAWGGHQQGLGWQYMQVNLAAFTGQVVRLRFSFASDSSGSSPGIYVDDFLVQ